MLMDLLLLWKLLGCHGNMITQQRSRTENILPHDTIILVHFLKLYISHYCMCIRMYVCMYVCSTYVCIYVYMYMYVMHEHIHEQCWACVDNMTWTQRQSREKKLFEIQPDRMGALHLKVPTSKADNGPLHLLAKQIWCTAPGEAQSIHCSHKYNTKMHCTGS